MKNLFENKYFLLLCRIVIALVFIFAGAEKISDPDSFAQSIQNYKLLPISTLNFIAIILPWIELTSGLLLLFGLSVKENSLIILCLLGIFTLAVIISLFRGLNIECGCFGGNGKIGLLKLLENFLMIIATILLIVNGSDLFNLKSPAADK